MAVPSYGVGIDFGTSTTLVAEGVGAGRAAVVPIGETEPWLPSVATLLNGRIVVGEEAEVASPGKVIRSVKRAITERKAAVTSRDGSVTARVDDVIRAILAELAVRARANGLDIRSEGAIRLGCPAMWDADQRRRLLTLAQSAGFAVGASTLIEEPIAAGLMWIEEQTRNLHYLDHDRVLVFDMGGGTLDIAVLDVTTAPRREPEIYVLASEGINEAGDRLDATIAGDLEHLLAQRGVAVTGLSDPVLARAHIQRAATAAKVALTDSTSTDIHLDYRFEPLPDLSYSVEQLNECLRPQMENAWRLVDSTVRAALLASEQRLLRNELRSTTGLRQMSPERVVETIQHVVLVGGMSRIPGVARYLGERFPAARVHTFARNAPQEAIAAGLAERVSYEHVNLHLPGFDFVLDIPGSGAITLYRAHTPLYKWWEAQSRTRLSYSWPDGATAYQPARSRDLPRTGYGTLRVLALDGSVVTMRGLKGVETSGLRVNFGHMNPRFVLAPDGTMTIVDGRQEEQVMRIQQWPALRSVNGKLTLRVEEKRWKPDDRRAWDTK